MKNEVKNGIIIAICVMLIIVVVYFSTAIFMTGEIGRKKSKTTTTTTSEIKSEYDNMIIASNTFKMYDDEYMVIFYSSKDSSDDLKNAISNYSGELKLYKVNTHEAINSYVKSDYDNKTANESNDLKIKDNALITIKNGTITTYVSNDEEIINALK